MTDRPEKNTAKRRDFLKLVGLGSVASAAALATGTPAKAELSAKPKPSGYRETEHIRKYYETARS
ncbi:MAG: twin-arginine translocation signal domain-containing protein [Alphaproteobacteria bacterium]|nr:twin-arginine translocation signal domain-containing protein [Alphaproteobacteria bacterium]MDE2496057.1 twin-arginine translocation signal domain-containing protein [Alphaproteobacteria bacterium]